MQSQTAAKTAENAVLTKATVRAADLLDITARMLASVIGVSEATVSRMRRNEFVLERGTKPFELAVLFVRLFRSLDAIVGGDAVVARAWLKNANTAFDAAPLEKILTITGLVDVIAYLDSDALSSETVGIDSKYWRMVEAQHHVSTLKIVDTLDEQAMLEDLIEETKPQIPIECRHLHYLLATPFRYGSVYPHGSRFRRAGRTKGVYYAAETMMTAVAEMAFYRLLFFAESPKTPWPSDAAEYTAFAAAIKCAKVIDLTRPPLDRNATAWTHPTDYAACQAIADTAREAGLEAIRYRSARDPKGANIALLTCRGFAKAKPLEPRTWRIRLGAFGVQAICEFPEKRIEFSRTAFADPRLAGLRWERGH